MQQNLFLSSPTNYIRWRSLRRQHLRSRANRLREIFAFQQFVSRFQCRIEPARFVAARRVSTTLRHMILEFTEV
jgi:hypothetical protein